MDEGGVKVTAGVMVRRESLASLCHFQLLTPLSTQQVETPLALGNRGRAEMLTHLAEEIEEVQTINRGSEFNIYTDTILTSLFLISRRSYLCTAVPVGVNVKSAYFRGTRLEQ